MNNIFEGAKFGDKFLTRDGRIAIFIRYDKDGEYDLETEESSLYARNDGSDYFTKKGHSSCSDIVSRYQEPIDEDKLDELAFNAEKETFVKYSGIPYQTRWVDGFKAGYRKAMEE